MPKLFSPMLSDLKNGITNAFGLNRNRNDSASSPMNGNNGNSINSSGGGDRNSKQSLSNMKEAERININSSDLSNVSNSSVYSFNSQSSPSPKKESPQRNSSPKNGKKVDIPPLDEQISKLSPKKDGKVFFPNNFEKVPDANLSSPSTRANNESTDVFDEVNEIMKKMNSNDKLTLTREEVEIMFCFFANLVNSDDERTQEDIVDSIKGRLGGNNNKLSSQPFVEFLSSHYAKSTNPPHTLSSSQQQINANSSNSVEDRPRSVARRRHSSIIVLDERERDGSKGEAREREREKKEREGREAIDAHMAGIDKWTFDIFTLENLCQTYLSLVNSGDNNKGENNKNKSDNSSAGGVNHNSSSSSLNKVSGMSVDASLSSASLLTAVSVATSGVRSSYGFSLVLVTENVLERLHLIESLDLNEPRLRQFLLTLQSSYQSVPYHNQLHAADVTQAVFWLGEVGGVFSTLKLSALQLLGMTVAAAIHDVNHPGRTGKFLVSNLSELAIRYNDSSPLENMHLATAFSLWVKPEHDFTKNLSKGSFLDLRRQVIELVLATDNDQHFDLAERLETLVNTTALGYGLSNNVSGKSNSVNNSLNKSVSIVAANNNSVVPVYEASSSAITASSTSTASTSNFLATPRSRKGEIHRRAMSFSLPSSRRGSCPPHVSASANELLNKISPRFPGGPSSSQVSEDVVVLTAPQVTLVMKAVLHCADISSPARPWQLYQQWSKRIMEEFYAEGDEQRELGLPITFAFNRQRPEPAHIFQLGFIKVLVSPLFCALSRLPGAHLSPVLDCMNSNILNYEEEARVSKEVSPSISAYRPVTPVRPNSSFSFNSDDTNNSNSNNSSNALSRNIQHLNIASIAALDEESTKNSKEIMKSSKESEKKEEYIRDSARLDSQRDKSKDSVDFSNLRPPRSTPSPSLTDSFSHSRHSESMGSMASLSIHAPQSLGSFRKSGGPYGSAYGSSLLGLNPLNGVSQNSINRSGHSTVSKLFVEIDDAELGATVVPSP